MYMWHKSAVAVFLALSAGATQFNIECDHPDAQYKIGETAVFTVTAVGQPVHPPKGMASVRLDNFGDHVFLERSVDLAKEPTFTVKGRMDRPGFLMLRISEGKRVSKLCSAAYEPEKLRPYLECPADFDTFWDESIKRYDREVPEQIQATEVEPTSPGTKLYELAIPATGGRTVWAYYSVPTNPPSMPMPLSITVPGAGPVTYYDNASVRFANLFINVHYYRPVRGLGSRTPEGRALMRKEAELYLPRYPVEVEYYANIGIAASREEYFLHGAILAANRAIDWACSRPGIDTNRVWYVGQSQGGGMGIILTGLNPRIRRAVVKVPAMTDHLGFHIDNRQAGWPRMIEAQLPVNRPAAERNAPYFDAIYFARRIHVPIRFNVGSIDTVCPPHAGYTAYNICPSKDKAMRMGLGQPHKPDDAIAHDLSVWLWSGR